MPSSHIRRPSQRLSTATFTLPSSSSSSDSEDDDDAPLPFPTALPRSDFLGPDFEPASYLSSLPNRHQTLEDLRSDLRDRSAAISAELLELVNSNYTAFLSLGSELRGGDEKVQDVKVALLGFRRAVEEVNGKVAGRRIRAGQLTTELRHVRTEIETARNIMEASERLSSLEERLLVDSLAKRTDSLTIDTDDEDDEDETEDNGADGLLASSPTKLLLSSHEYNKIQRLLGSLDQNQPFVIKMEARLTKCKNTLLLDLGNALREARKAGTKGQARTLRYLSLYRLLDADAEAIKAVRPT